MTHILLLILVLEPREIIKNQIYNYNEDIKSVILEESDDLIKNNLNR